MTDRTLKSKVSKLQELQAEIDTMTAEAEAIKDQIKTEMAARSVDELEAGNAIIRWKPVLISMPPKNYVDDYAFIVCILGLKPSPFRRNL